MSIKLRKVSDLAYETEGARTWLNAEIFFHINNLDMHDYFYEIVEIIIDHMNSGNNILCGETITIGMWMMKLKRTTDYYEFFSYNPHSTKYDELFEYCTNIWSSQRSVCAENGAGFYPPRPDQLLVISPQALSTREGIGTRYEAPDHMSGWWIVDENEEIEISGLKLLHPMHLDDSYCEFIKNLALPVGSNFNSKMGTASAQLRELP